MKTCFHTKNSSDTCDLTYRDEETDRSCIPVLSQRLLIGAMTTARQIYISFHIPEREKSNVSNYALGFRLPSLDIWLCLICASCEYIQEATLKKSTPQYLLYWELEMFMVLLQNGWEGSWNYREVNETHVCAMNNRDINLYPFWHFCLSVINKNNSYSLHVYCVCLCPGSASLWLCTGMIMRSTFIALKKIDLSPSSTMNLVWCLEVEPMKEWGIFVINKGT